MRGQHQAERESQRTNDEFDTNYHADSSLPNMPTGRVRSFFAEFVDQVFKSHFYFLFERSIWRAMTSCCICDVPSKILKSRTSR